MPKRNAALIAILLLQACTGQAPPAVPVSVDAAQLGGNSRGALLYVSDPPMGVVHVYSYPQLAEVGSLKDPNDPSGLCTDKSGNVWVVDAAHSQLVEYAHGGTQPIATLSEQEGEYPDACAVNPVNGDIAVANVTWQGSDPGSLAIFRDARGSPKFLRDRRIFEMYFVSYDDRGNLFVDGWGYRHPGPLFFELPYGATRLSRIPLHGATIRLPGGVQYATGVVAIGDAKRAIVYRVSGGRVTGKTRLARACYVEQFFILGARLFAPSTCGSGGHTFGSLLIYDYPSGGKPVKTLGAYFGPFAAVISR